MERNIRSVCLTSSILAKKWTDFTRRSLLLLLLTLEIRMTTNTKLFFMKARGWRARSPRRLPFMAGRDRCGNRSGEHPIQGIPAEDRRGKRSLLPRGTVRFVLI